jgi:hypothetical protein
MKDEDRSAVLYAVALGPWVGLRVAISYLRMKRAARRGEKKFYRELRRSGLPKAEARYLAEEYSGAISVRNLISGLRGTIPSMSRK